MNKRLLLALLLFGLVSLSGCSILFSGGTDINEELKALLPGDQGVVWRYFGFAEYDHFMTLNAIEEAKGVTRYLISGEVGDPSGGEAQTDFALQIVYTLQKGVWVQEKQEEAMMDSHFDTLEILRRPVEQGKSWTQKQVDRNGQERTLLSTIEQVRTEEGLKVVRVKYQDQGSPYYEIREIRQGVGITMFEKLWLSPEGNFEIGYQLFEFEK
jgi:hypothetical protein